MRRADPRTPRRPTSWDTLRRRHRRIALAFTLATAGLFLLVSPPVTVQALLLGAAVIVLGLPHGATDPCDGKLLFAPRFGRAWAFPFSIAYLLVAGSMLAFWWIDSVAALAAFLTISSYHFGNDYRDESPIRRIAFGSAPILLAGAFHPEATTYAYNALLIDGSRIAPDDVAFVSRGSLLFVLGVALIEGFATTSPTRGGARTFLAAGPLGRFAFLSERSGRDLAGFTVLFAATPPLVAFTIYFCAWHSVRHSIGTASRLDPRDATAGLAKFARTAAPLTIVSALGFAVAAGWFLASGRSLDTAVIGSVFLGLSALTVPHVLLEDQAESRFANDPPERLRRTDRRTAMPKRAAPAWRFVPALSNARGVSDR